MAKLIRNNKSSKKDTRYIRDGYTRACVKIPAEVVASLLLGVHSDKIHFIEARNNPRYFYLYHGDANAPGQVLYDLKFDQIDPE